MSEHIFAVPVRVRRQVSAAGYRDNNLVIYEFLAGSQIAVDSRNSGAVGFE